MSFSLRFHESHLPIFSNNWRRFMLWGLVLTVLGLFAISATAFTTLLSVVAIGFVFFIGGAIIAADTLTFWWGRWHGFTLHLAVALLYLYVGLTLIGNPVASAAPLTLVVGVFYLVIGAFRIGTSSSLQLPGWGWNVINGVVSFILGLLIVTNWQAASMFLIGLFVGIDLFFCGIAYIMAALAAKSLSSRTR
jgi:uncharacterized membrane protein HdeD (DUF308 family)